MRTVDKKTSQKLRKGFLLRKIDLIFKAIEWSLFLFLCVIAGMFMIDVITQFQARETFIGHSLKPIDKLPTVMLFMHMGGYWEYSKDIEIYIWNEGSYKLLKENEPFNHHGHMNTTLTQVSPLCFKLNTSISSSFKKGKKISFLVTLHDKYSDMEVVFTSEANSYGVFGGEWFDGKAYVQRMRLGEKKDISFTTTETKFLEKYSDCSVASFLDQWMPYLTKANFSTCSEKCAYFKFMASNELPFCNFDNYTNWMCNFDIAHESYADFITNIGYKRPCDMLEYDGIHTGELPAVL